MSTKHFSFLLILTMVVALLAALLVPERTSDDPDANLGPLFPLAETWVNDVEWLRIVSVEGELRLTRRDAQWQVDALAGYPADWERLRTLLADLAQAEVIELKTDNPQYYSRLGVEDPSMPGAGGLLLEFEAGGERHGLVVGNSATTRSGQYVRLADSATSLLIDRELTTARTAVEWAMREIADVASSAVAEVEIIHPDGDWVLAAKATSADTDFTLKSLPEGREISSSWSVNALGGALSGLNMDNVSPVGAPTADATVRLRLLTFDGIEYTLQAWKDDDAAWITAKASVPARATEPAADAESATPDVENLQAAADAFNRRVARWQFQIPEYKFQTLTQRSESLLQPLEDAQQPSGG